ncbi:MAG: hypothetical protein ACM3JB_19195 [Acidobacteriaceae bacterium]
MAQAKQSVQLQPETLHQFRAYVVQAEIEMKRTEREDSAFLWADTHPERAERVREGAVLAQFWSGSKPLEVSHGLIHDWIGAARISGTTIDQTLHLLQDYNNHKNIYQPEVIDSRLLGRDGDNFQVYLRLLKKKIITVVLDTNHDVNYYSPASGRWCCRSATTRIMEVEDSGTPDEKVLPADSGHGFLWRLYSYWRFKENTEGVSVECRAISLTRDVPRGLGWMIEPIIRNLPKESLVRTLDATRRALAQFREV